MKRSEQLTRVWEINSIVIPLELEQRDILNDLLEKARDQGAEALKELDQDLYYMGPVGYVAVYRAFLHSALNAMENPIKNKDVN